MRALSLEHVKNSDTTLLEEYLIEKEAEKSDKFIVG